MSQTGLKNISPLSDAQTQKLTFEEYLDYQDNTDTKYELYRGKLIPMATPTGLHTKICKYLAYQFQLFFAAKDLSLVSISDVAVRTDIDTARIPDVIVCTPQLWEKVCDRAGAGVLDFKETPRLVVEVTSENWREDYLLKRAEYALIEIPEYWLVDPKKQKVRILNHPEREDGYEHQDFIAGENIHSLEFPEFILSVEEILSPPIVEDLIKAQRLERKQLEQELEQERQRAEKLAALLKERGIEPI